MGINTTGAPDAELLNEGSSYAPRVPTNRIDLDHLVRWDTGRTFTASTYETGRDADATNQLHFNVPTGAGFEFSINDVAVLKTANAGRHWYFNGATGDFGGYGTTSAVLTLNAGSSGTESGVETVGESVTQDSRVGSFVVNHTVSGAFKAYGAFEVYRGTVDDRVYVALRSIGDSPLTAKRLYWGELGNLGLNTNTFSTNAKGVLALTNDSAPTSGPADTVQFYSSDESAGHTIPSFYCEGTNVIATGQTDIASSVRVKMRVNGTVVTLLAI